MGKKLDDLERSMYRNYVSVVRTPHQFVSDNVVVSPSLPFSPLPPSIGITELMTDAGLENNVQGTNVSSSTSSQTTLHTSPAQKSSPQAVVL